MGGVYDSVCQCRSARSITCTSAYKEKGRRMIVYCIDDTNLEMMRYTDVSYFYSYKYSSPQVGQNPFLIRYESKLSISLSVSACFSLDTERWNMWIIFGKGPRSVAPWFNTSVALRDRLAQRKCQTNAVEGCSNEVEVRRVRYLDTRIDGRQ